MKMRNIILTCCLGFLLSACSDFLEEYSQDQYHPSSAVDLNELLLGSGYWGDMTFVGLTALPDDANESRSHDPEQPPAGWGFYTFLEFPNYDEDDNVWKRIYESIGVANAIIGKIDDFSSDTLYNKVKGEAYFLRGCGYFFLANLYAQPYAKATASSTLGVPLKLTNYVEGKNWHRSPLDSVYNAIVSDLEMAADCLQGVEQPSIYRANEWAALALLSRVYLYMGEYEKCVETCDKVLACPDYMIPNLTTAASDSCFADLAASEIIFSQGGYVSAVTSFVDYSDFGMGIWPSFEVNCYIASKQLVTAYEPTDARRTVFFRTDMAGYVACYKVKYDASKPVSDFGAIRLSEVVLNKAEAQAMLDQNAQAVETLKELTGLRYTEAPVIPASGKDLVTWIRDERRRELCFEGHRWFDLRRYAVDSKYPFTTEIVHVEHTGNMMGMRPLYVYVLPAYDVDNRNWVLPIPEKETALTETMKPNEREDIESVPYDENLYADYE